jgi:excisionase family DNA binding protein
MARPSPSPSPWISLQQVADLLGVTTRTARRYVADGRIDAIRVGPKLLRFDLAKVEAAFSMVPTTGSFERGVTFRDPPTGGAAAKAQRRAASTTPGQR